MPRLLRDMSAQIALPESGVPSGKGLSLFYGRVSNSKLSLVKRGPYGFAEIVAESRSRLSSTWAMSPHPHPHPLGPATLGDHLLRGQLRNSGIGLEQRHFDLNAVADHQQGEHVHLQCRRLDSVSIDLYLARTIDGAIFRFIGQSHYFWGIRDGSIADF